MRSKVVVISMASILAACGSGGGGDSIDAPDIDAPDIDAPSIDAPIDAPVDARAADGPPLGPAHTYVISQLSAPYSATEATTLGLDIDQRPGDSNGGIDNQLGTFLGSLRGIAPGFDVNVPIAEGIDRGQTIYLVNIEAAVLTTASARMALYSGDPSTAMPTPCLDANDPVCRRHLTGAGQFTLLPGAPTDRSLDGAVTVGLLRAGPGRLAVRLPLVSGPAPELVLHQARVEIRVTAAGFGAGSKLGGGIKQTDIVSVLHPALHQQWTAIIDRDCPPPRTPPSCNCTPSSTGQSLLSFLDSTPRDCTVTLAEVTSTMNSLLSPDLDLFNASGALGPDGVNDAVSLGLGVQAAPGTFPVP